MPTDIDGMVEKNGHFLFLEGKSWRASLTGGQEIALRALSRQPKTTVIVFYGEALTKNFRRITRADNGVFEPVEEPSVETLQRLVSEWYAEALSASAEVPRRATPRPPGWIEDDDIDFGLPDVA